MVWKAYFDIIDRIDEKPKWWVEGLPRYCEFAPNLVVAKFEVAYVRAACEACGQEFNAAVPDPGRYYGLTGFERLALNAEFGVGDVPHMRCCRSGPLMSAFELDLLEYWESGGPGLWRRRDELEGPLNGDGRNPARRRSAYDLLEEAGLSAECSALIEKQDEAAIAALLIKAHHPYAEIAAAASIKMKRYRDQARSHLT